MTSLISQLALGFPYLLFLQRLGLQVGCHDHLACIYSYLFIQKKFFYSELLVPVLIFDNQPDTFNVLVPLLLAS